MPETMTPIAKSNTTANPYRISASRALRESGMSLEDCSDGTCPACCKEGCIVEPDGECEHGCPSVLIAAGLI